MPEPNTLAPPPDPDPKPDAVNTASWIPPTSPALPHGGATVTSPGSTPGAAQHDQQTRTEDTERIGPDLDDPARLPNVPGYRVEKLIGRGGMGSVYRAVHLELNRVVALKLINPGGRDDDLRERFGREVKALAAIEHANVVPVYHAGDWYGFPYVTMKFVPGGPLSHHLARFRGNPDAVARLVAKVARGVQALHAAGVLHRDLKPLNILLGEGDEPLVADFGLAKWVDEPGSDLTVTHVPLGTRQYMSPEQTLGQKARYGPGCDIWAIGVILHELLAGRRPFADTDTSELYEQIRTADPPPLPPAIPAPLGAIARKCLAKNPEDRYPSAAAVADDLDRWTAGLPVSVPDAPPASPPRVVALGVCALLALIFLPAALIPLGPARAPSVVDPRPGSPAPAPKPKPTIAERIRAGKTVVLIDENGRPQADYVVLPGCVGAPVLHRDGFYLNSASFLAIEFVSDPLPLPVRLEAEYAVIMSSTSRSAAGVYVGGKQVASPNGWTNTFCRVVERDNFKALPFHPGLELLVEKVELELCWWDRQLQPEQMGYGSRAERKVMPIERAPTLGWHSIGAVVRPQEIEAYRDQKPFAVLTEEKARSFFTRVAASHKLGPTEIFLPAFGPGMGLCVENAEAVFRNMKLVPLNP
jgi:eukaryotic-like serine/threonine-protein kinase